MYYTESCLLFFFDYCQFPPNVQAVMRSSIIGALRLEAELGNVKCNQRLAKHCNNINQQQQLEWQEQQTMPERASWHLLQFRNWLNTFGKNYDKQFNNSCNWRQSLCKMHFVFSLLAAKMTTTLMLFTYNRHRLSAVRHGTLGARGGRRRSTHATGATRSAAAWRSGSGNESESVKGSAMSIGDLVRIWNNVIISTINSIAANGPSII